MSLSCRSLSCRSSCSFQSGTGWHTSSTKCSRANIFFLGSASNIVPPIVPLIPSTHLETILLSVVVRLLPPPLVNAPVGEFPFRAVRPPGVVVKISTNVVRSYLQLPSFTSSLPPTHAPSLFIWEMSVIILYQWVFQYYINEGEKLAKWKQTSFSHLKRKPSTSLLPTEARCPPWSLKLKHDKKIENLQHLQDFSPTDHVSLVSLNL